MGERSTSAPAWDTHVVQMYLFLLPLFRPPTSPPWAATIVYLLLWTVSLIYVGMFLYVRASDGIFPEWATLPRRLAEGANIIVTTCLLLTVGGLKLVSPEALARLVGVQLKLPRLGSSLRRKLSLPMIWSLCLPGGPFRG